jgi:hypothetical protein
MPKQTPTQQKPTVTRDDHEREGGGQRGEATKLGGNKVHGDDLEGAIPTTPMTVDRPTRDDGDNDDKGAPK